MKCPKCEGELRRIDLSGVQVDQCEKCSGIWFDFGELEQVLSRDDTQKLKGAVERDPARDAHGGVCPRCGRGTMIRLTVLASKGLHIDSCSRCYGQWLDGGELEELRRAGVFSSVADFFREIL